jgi:hypothetical protein
MECACASVASLLLINSRRHKFTHEVYRKLMRNRRTDAFVILSQPKQQQQQRSPLALFLKTINFVWCLGPTLANMGPYSQATTEATKSIVDRELCQLLTY